MKGSVIYNSMIQVRVDDVVAFVLNNFDRIERDTQAVEDDPALYELFTAFCGFAHSVNDIYKKYSILK